MFSVHRRVPPRAVYSRRLHHCPPSSPLTLLLGSFLVLSSCGGGWGRRLPSRAGAHAEGVQGDFVVALFCLVLRRWSGSSPRVSSGMSSRYEYGTWRVWERGARISPQSVAGHSAAALGGYFAGRAPLMQWQCGWCAGSRAVRTCSTLLDATP
eukprot:3642220-Prymnesium_polylepis.1